MLPRPQSSRFRQLRQQLIGLQHPMSWGTAAVLLLSGLFLMEYWQPQAAVNRPVSNSLQLNSPNDSLPYQGASNDAFRSGSGLPDLPLPVLPGESSAQLPIDPTLPLLPERSSQDKAQAQPRSTADRLPPFSPGLNSRSASDPSEDLYNPMGIPLPESWQRRSRQRQSGLSTAPQSEAQPLPSSASSANPLQSALDRLGNEEIENGAIGNGAMGDGAMGNGAMGNREAEAEAGQPDPTQTSQTMPQGSYAPVPPAMPQAMPRPTGYTLPPAFRTTENTSPFGSPTASPAQPAMTDSSTSVPSAPQPNLGQSAGNNPSNGAIGGGEINTFSNP